MRRLTALILILLLATFCPAIAEEYRVIYPSERESTIVDARDFYVIATVPDDAREAVVKLLDANGEAVRVITGGNDPVFFVEYENLNAFNTESSEYLMPDLIYEPDDPDSLWDGSIKCCVKNGLLFCVVPGGRFVLDGRDIVDENGEAYPRLERGEYTIVVEAGGETITQPLTLAPTPEKVMSRFSPDNHLSKLTETAQQGGIRTYFDPLPGYWSPSAIIPGQENNPYFAEIKDRWQLADAMEYESGVIHFFIYNLSPYSATNMVELATLQLDDAIETRMKAYHYDIGEPILAYTDEQSDVYLLGTFIPFDEGDHLAFTRGEVTELSQEGFYVAYEGEPRPIDLDVLDGVSVPVGRQLTLFGVTKPIQNDPSDVVQVSYCNWEVRNRVTELEYTFTCEDNSWSERRDASLTRLLAEGWEGYSIYEFAHSFSFPEQYAGKSIEAAVQGFDAHNQPVEGTGESFTINVTQ